MVQIPEYTRRENAQPVQRGGINLNVPSIIGDPGARTAGAQKALKLSSELADVYVGMKERRDDGIVSAFMNQYDKDSTQKIIELQEKYRGQDAKRVMPEFQKWRDSYIAEHSSYDPDSAKEGIVYLEDAAQNRIAKQKLDSYNVRDINSISSYIAREEEEFRVNNLKTSVANNSEKIMAEGNLFNVESLKKDIYSDVASLYRGQSKEYIKKAYGDVIDSALYGNVMRDSASDPMSSIDRFESKPIYNDMKTETKQKAHAALLKSFVDYQAQQLANAQTGRPATPAGQDFYTSHASFFGSAINDIKSEIDAESVKLANNILEKDQRELIAVRNNLSVQLIDAQAKGDTQQMAQVLSAMSGVRGGVETAQRINNVDKEFNDYNFLKKAMDMYRMGPGTYIVDGVIAPPVEEVNERLNLYRFRRINMEDKLFPVIEDINMDKYNTLLDIPDFEEFSPSQKEEILASFARRARYNSLIETSTKESKVNFGERIKQIYKNSYGDPNKNPVEFNRFNFEMSKQIVEFMAENPNKIPEPKDLQQMARRSVTTSAGEVIKPEYDVFVNMSREMDEMYPDKTHRDYGTTFEVARKLLDKKCKGVWRNAEEKKALDRATSLYIDGYWDRAYNELADVGLLERHDLEGE